MKITLTNNYYQGLAVNKNNQNKKNIQTNKTVTNSVAFGGPELPRKIANAPAAARATQTLAQTAQRAVRLLNVEQHHSASKDKVVTINGITYTNPEYYTGTNIVKSCECATRGCLDQEGGLRTYIKPEYYENGKIKSCEKLTAEYVGRDDKVTKETFVDYRFGEYRKHITEFEDGRIVEESRPQRHHMFQKEKAR